jgi:iron complex transport system substrate-binding protein
MLIISARQLLQRAIGGLLAIGLVAAAHGEILARDDAGSELRLGAPARRIVSLAPHLTELLFAAGAGAQLVGAVDYSNHPPEARRIPRVGSYGQIDLEAVVALKPDLVVAWQSGNPSAAVDKLQRLGLPVFVSEPGRIEDVARSLEQLGRLAGTESAAGGAASAYRERLAGLRARYGGRPIVRTFYEVWNQPLTTIGGKQIISDLLRLCGGENVFGQLAALAPTVTVEAVLAADPEAIVASGMDEARPEWLDEWRRWRRLAAVERGNLFFVPPDLMQRHTPRLLDGAEVLCRHLETARARR